MGQVSFYHLEKQPIEAALPRLLEKVLSAGHKVLVRVGAEETLSQIDEALWTYDPASFLPHGRADDTYADLQPVLLSKGEKRPNSADVCVVLDAAMPADLSSFARCLYMFDSRDQSALVAARQNWKDLKAAGHDVTYWQQSDTGGWQKKA